MNFNFMKWYFFSMLIIHFSTISPQTPYMHETRSKIHSTQKCSKFLLNIGISNWQKLDNNSHELTAKLRQVLFTFSCPPLPLITCFLEPFPKYAYANL